LKNKCEATLRRGLNLWCIDRAPAVEKRRSVEQRDGGTRDSPLIQEEQMVWTPGILNLNHRRLEPCLRSTCVATPTVSLDPSRTNPHTLTHTRIQGGRRKLRAHRDTGDFCCSVQLNCIFCLLILLFRVTCKAQQTQAENTPHDQVPLVPSHETIVRGAEYAILITTRPIRAPCHPMTGSDVRVATAN
jgi:hypothetical protein